MNIGDALADWSGGAWVAAVHRVAVPLTADADTSRKDGRKAEEPAADWFPSAKLEAKLECGSKLCQGRRNEVSVAARMTRMRTLTLPGRQQTVSSWLLICAWQDLCTRSY